MARLILRTGEGEEKTFDLGDGAVTIGRGDGNTIPLNDSKSSRKHCQIEKTPAGYKLVDLESRNGTKVNGLMVNQHLLKPGDKIEVGAAIVEFQDTLTLAGEGSAAAAPGLAPPPSPGVRPATVQAPPGAPPRQRRPSTEIRVPTPQERAMLHRPSRAPAWVSTAVVFGVVLLGAWFLYWVVSSSVRDNQIEQWRRTLSEAVAMREASPQRARELAQSIPVQAGETYRRAQDLVRQIDNDQQQSQVARNSPMTQEFLALQHVADTTNHWQQMLDGARHFEETYGAQMTPAMRDELDRIRRKARDGIDQMRNVDLGLLQQRVDEAVADHPPRFGDAVAAYQTARPAFADSPEFQERADAVYRGILGRAETYFNEQDRRVVELQSQDADAAAQVCEEMRLAFGNDLTGPFEQKIRTIEARLQALQPH